MKKKMIWLILAVIAFAAVLAGAMVGYKYLSKLYAPEAPEESTSLRAAPDFTVLDGAGESVSLSSQLGKPVVVNFWATWCGPCQSEMPAFDAMYKKYGDQVSFMMVDLTDGSRDTVESASSFIKARGYSFPVYFDTTLAAANAYGAYSIPMTVLISADGKIVASHTGAMSEDTLEQYIDQIL